jgi:uncharacterized protein
MDDKLASIYRKAAEDSVSEFELEKEELAWMKSTRNTCKSDECISAAYTLRIAQLNDVNTESVEIPPSELIPEKSQKPSKPTALETTTLDSSGLKTQTVIAEGVGSNVESAAQNAAENALKQVVGTFIDAQKQLDKHFEISNGIRNETKTISTNIKEYSQGTIKGFKLIDSQQDGALIRVNAEVLVRIDDFHAYINKLAEGEVAVDQGLFVKMATEKKQQSNLSSILFDNVIAPVTKGSVIVDPEIRTID